MLWAVASALPLVVLVLVVVVFGNEDVPQGFGSDVRTTVVLGVLLPLRLKIHEA